MSSPTSKVLEHLNRPRHAGVLEQPDAVGKANFDGRAPRVTIYLCTDGTTITKASFETFGCGYSIALCSVLMETIVGSNLSDCSAVTAKQLIDALDGVPRERRFCADIAVKALHDALEKLAGLKTS
jgi:nitrogen fixation NifU-like protein